MADRTLAENVAQVKADFKAIKDAVPYVFNDDTPTSEYGERIFTEISSLQYQADSAWDQGFYNGIEQGRVEGYENGKTDGITEGVEQGKQEIISNSKYIEKSASGKAIRLDDVSEVAHKVVVKADTPTEVKLYGKNLIPFPYNPSMPLSQNGITLTINDDGSIVANGTASALTQFHIYHCYFATNPISILPNIKYTLSGCSGGSSTTYEMRITDNRSTATITQNAPATFSYADTSQIVISILVRSGATLNNVVFKPQVEYGENYTGFEPYQEPQTITATPSGTEVSSICPIMIFLADSDVTVDYFGSYGMQTEWDRFWDAFQQNGTRASYTHAFYGAGWSEAIFRPKYDIVATSLVQTFYNSPIKDLTSILEKQGVALDTSNCTSLSFAFAHTKITNIPKINMSACTNSSSTFVTSTSLVRIEGIVSSEKTVFDKSTFQNCTALEHCIFEGTVASDINLQWSTKLDLESLISLFECLKHFGGSGNEYTKTITLSPESWGLTNREEFITRFDGFGGQDVAHQKGWNYA